ncbi:MAG: hypothetical protein KY467_02810 [Gemmatimonadetes bacterium]|nr:hypothetical protein [Gemmatimonadota bacterium]
MSTSRNAPQSAVRVPVVRQTGASDCGLAALEMVFRYHGAKYERNHLRRAVGDTSGGSTLESLRAAAHACGFEAEGFEAPPDTLQALPAPAILHWRRGHFVVFEGLRDGRVSIVDPAGGRVLLDCEELGRLYSGCALVLEPEHQPAPTPGDAGSGSGSEWGRAWSVLSPWVRRERTRIARLGAWALGMGASASAGVWWAGGAFTAAMEAGALHPAAAIAVAALCLGAAAGLSRRAARLETVLSGTVGDFLAQRFVRMAANAPREYLASRTSRFLEHLAGDLDPAVNPRLPSLRCIRLGGLALAAAAVSLWVSVVVGLGVLVSLAVVAAGAGWRTRRWRHRAMRWRGAVQAAREWGRAVLTRPVDLRAGGGLTPALERWAELRAGAHGAMGGSSPAPPEPHVGLLGAAFAGLALLTGSAAVTGDLAHGDAVVVLLLGTAALGATHAAAGEIARLRAWAASLAALADACLEVPDPARPGEPAGDPDGTLRCRSVCHAAGGHERLSPTSVEAAPGESIAVLGDAEARTAFAHLVLGLARPSDGALTIGGIQVAQVDEALRRTLAAGVLAGAEPLAATILDNFQVVYPACGRAAVLDACTRVGLGDWLATRPLGELTPLSPGTLPGPASRLLCLARLLPRLPLVLVLDGTLDELGVDEARALARSLHTLPCIVVLCTGRSDIIPSEYRLVRVSSSSAA